MNRIVLRPDEERRLRRGHLWVYRNECQEPPDFPDGTVVDVYSSDNRFSGRGFFQKEGGIAVRLLSRHQEEIGPAFLASRIDAAQALREKLFPGETVYRLAYGECDALPGLVVDRYGSVAVVRTECVFYEPYLSRIIRAIKAIPGVAGVHAQAGPATMAIGEVADGVEACVDDLSMRFSMKGSQKTGMFLDQRFNTRLVRPLASGAKVFDGHCYIGMWSCTAARAGAVSVLGVDRSQAALDQAVLNAEANGFADTCKFVRGDVLETLDAGEMYDVVVIDPPALAKARSHASKAMGLYQALNRSAMKAVSPGGFLVTSSCSHFVTMDDFMEILKRAARAVQRDVQILGVYGAGPDHPIMLAMPETAYLKCVMARIL